MPVIPGADEGQVLNAGSPVPIASPEEQRGMGTAVAGFGKAMFQLGDALDKVMTAEKNRKMKLDVDEVLQAAEQLILEQKMKSEAAGALEDDPTGYGQVNSFVKNSQAAISGLLEASSVKDINTQRAIRNALNNRINDVSREVGATEVKKRVEANKVKEAKLMSTWTSLVNADPTKIEEAWAKGEELIITNTNISDSVKDIRVHEFKKQSIKAGVEGLLQKGVLRDDANAFAQAEIFLEQYAPNVLSPEEKAKLSDDIMSTQNRHYTTQYQKLVRDEKRRDAHIKEREKNLVSYYSSALALAGNNELKRKPIIAAIQTSVLKEEISSQAGKNLTESKVFSENQDDFYEATIMKRVFDTDNYSEASDMVYSDLLSGRVSTDRANAIIGKLKNLEERKRSDPHYNKLLGDGERLIRDMASPSILEPLKTFDKASLMTKVNMAVQDYHKAIANNPKADPTILSRAIIENRFGQRTAFIKGQENFMGLNSIDGVKKQREQLIREGFVKQKKGLFSTEEKKKLQENLKTLDAIEQSLKLKEESKAQPSTTQSTGTGAVPARGK